MKTKEKSQPVIQISVILPHVRLLMLGLLHGVERLVEDVGLGDGGPVVVVVVDAHHEVGDGAGAQGATGLRRQDRQEVVEGAWKLEKSKSWCPILRFEI